MIIIYRCPVVEASDCKMNCSNAASELTKKGIQKCKLLLITPGLIQLRKGFRRAFL